MRDAKRSKDSPFAVWKSRCTQGRSGTVGRYIYIRSFLIATVATYASYTNDKMNPPWLAYLLFDGSSHASPMQ